MSKYFELFDRILNYKSQKGFIAVFENHNDVFLEEVFSKDIDLSKLPKLILEVREDEGGDIPHFHLYSFDAKLGSKPSGKRIKKTSGIHTCIRLNSAEYFPHPGKEDKLNSKQARELDKLLRSDYEGDMLWKVMSKYWNNLPHTNIKVDLEKMPDYRNLE